MSAKMTLLELTQTILGALEDDEVNSITDTESADRVVDIIREVYYDILGSDMPEVEDFFELDTPSDTSTPVLMTLPDNVTGIMSVKYDKTETGDTGPNYKVVNYLPRRDFMNMTDGFDPADADVSTMTIPVGNNTLDFHYWTNSFPKYYTTFDDHRIIFDSFDSSEESFLQKNKTRCFGQTSPDFIRSDTFTPDLNTKQFSLLLSEAKAQAFEELGQRVSNVALRRARHNRIKLNRNKRQIPFPRSYYDQYPNYGRKTK